jgi:hypothetical protein
MEKGDYKQINFLTLNAQSSFLWQIQAILQELVWNDTAVVFISETGSFFPTDRTKTSHKSRKMDSHRELGERQEEERQRSRGSLHRVTLHGENEARELARTPAVMARDYTQTDDPGAPNKDSYIDNFENRDLSSSISRDMRNDRESAAPQETTTSPLNRPIRACRKRKELSEPSPVVPEISSLDDMMISDNTTTQSPTKRNKRQRKQQKNNEKRKRERSRTSKTGDNPAAPQKNGKTDEENEDRATEEPTLKKTKIFHHFRPVQNPITIEQTESDTPVTPTETTPEFSETERMKRASRKIDKNNKRVKKINLAQKYKNQIKLILKKKEIQEVTKKTPKKRKVFHTEEFDDTKFYNIPSFMEMDKAANLNNNDKIEKLNRDATARKDATAKKKARTMLEFIEHTEINTEFTASRKNPYDGEGRLQTSELPDTERSELLLLANPSHPPGISLE